jgi:hypothetical protein
MQLYIVILFVIGIFLILHGIYEERYRELQNNVQVEYRFIPRTYYEEQFFDNQFKSKMAPIFEKDDEWYHRNTGRDMSIDRRKL